MFNNNSKIYLLLNKIAVFVSKINKIFLKKLMNLMLLLESNVFLLNFFIYKYKEFYNFYQNYL